MSQAEAECGATAVPCLRFPFRSPPSSSPATSLGRSCAADPRSPAHPSATRLQTGNLLFAPHAPAHRRTAAILSSFQITAPAPTRGFRPPTLALIGRNPSLFRLLLDTSVCHVVVLWWRPGPMAQSPSNSTMGNGSAAAAALTWRRCRGYRPALQPLAADACARREHGCAHDDLAEAQAWRKDETVIKNR